MFEIVLTFFFRNVVSLFLLACLVYMLVCYVFKRDDERLPPGPRSWIPFFGIYPYLTEAPHLYLRELAGTYGEVFSFKIFGRTYIHLNSHEAIKDAFVSKSNAFSGRDTDFNLLNYVDDLQGIAQTEGEEWRDDRKFFLQNVKQFGFGKLELEPYIHEMTNRMIRKLRQINGKQVFAMDIFSIAAMNVAGKVFMSVEYDDLDDADFVKVQKDAFSFVAEFDSPRLLLSGPLYKHLMFRFSKNYQRYVRTKEAWHSASKMAIDKHLRTFNNNNIRDFTDRFLEVMQEKTQNGEHSKTLTIEKLHSILVNIYLDGMMTMSGALNNYVQLLALNPEVQDELREELNNIVGSERLPSWRDRTSLPYTQATFMELNRMAPVLPLSVPHKCTETIEFRGYVIPKNAIVLSNIWSVHYNEKVFENPEIFNPRRFLEENGKKLQDSVIAFGIGKRACIGEILARMESFAYITSLIQSFKITLPPGVGKDDCRNKSMYDVCFVPI